MIELFTIVSATVLLILLLTALVVLPMLYVEYHEHRRTRWIAVAPRMVELEPYQLPGGSRPSSPLFDPFLEEAGFRTAVVADAPGFGSEMRWSHILLLNGSSGERAGVTS